MEKSRKSLAAAVKAEFARVKKDIWVRLAGVDVDQANIIVAQNVLRDCLTAVLGEMVPFPVTTCQELAIRLASYAISGAPIDDQEAVLAQVVMILPSAHARRVGQGIMLRTQWGMKE